MSSIAENPRLDNPPTGPTVEDKRPSQTSTEDYRCSSCPLIKTKRDKVRNLVLCVDGTANQFSMMNTNVLELFSRLIKDEDQLAFYNSGIGTYAHPSFTSWHYMKQVIDHKIDLAIAWRFERIVHAAYEWLSENYEPGDRIFLFGFSRGAYQVRVIAGMIERVGLLHKGNKNQIPFAYELYAATTERGRRSSSEREKKSTTTTEGLSQSTVNDATKENTDLGSSTARRGPGRILRRNRSKESEYVKKTPLKTALDLCRQFKRTLSREDVKVHFVGAWDTVSSIGTARGVSLPETTSGMEHVCFFRHALALDERRVKFLPEYANGGLGPSAQPAKGEVKVKEVWFAGSHSDIGGGNTENKDLMNFGPALRWMTYEAMNCGLRMKPYEGNWIDIKRTDSMTGVWKVFEILPFRSLAYTDANSTTIVPHLAKPRIIQPHQLIHESVVNLIKSGHYAPRTRINLPGCSKLADLAHSPESLSAITETDPFSSASHGLSELKYACENLDKPNVDGDSSDISSKWHEFDTALTHLTYSETGGVRQTSTSVAEVSGSARTLLKALEKEYERRGSDSPTERVQTLIKLLSTFEPGSKWRESFESGSDLPPTPAQIERWTSSCQVWNREMVDKVLGRFASRLLQTCEISGVVQYMGVSSGSILITTKEECLTWDGLVNKPKQVHSLPPRTTNAVFSSDGHWVAYISYFHKLVVSTASGDVKAHAGVVGVFNMTFSHNHPVLATGTVEGGLTLWSIINDKLEPRRFAGHLDCVNWLAFSSDDSRLASASDDFTARIWDVDSGVELAVFGHQYPVLCVVWCPSGDEIISGGRNGRVTIWNTKDKTSHSFATHPSTVESLVFSPDGNMLAIGGGDKIQIWNFINPALLWTFSAKEPVYTLSFLDNKRLVSGESYCVELWDVDADI